MKVDISGVVKKNRATSGFGFKVMLRGSICLSGPFPLQLSCGTVSNITYSHSSCQCCCSILILY